MNARVAIPLLFVLALSLFAVAAPDDTDGFLPKDALGVTALQREIPEADGRGVVVAVLDTGVDLLHHTLTKNPDGSPKVVDFFDGTNAGEVETTTLGHVKNGRIVGLSGRRLRLGEGVPADVRLGLVRATEIYPGRLLRRLRRERNREREWMKRIEADRAVGGKAPPAPRDPGDPVHDLVLWQGEGGWRVVVDTDSDGDLAEEKVLREYPVAREVAIIADPSRFGFGVRVLRKGSAVSLLFDGGGHGTHVAGIIAGYDAPGSPLNGLAPAAKIIAVKIGNGRLGGATTHLAMLSALEWAGRAGADVVNISFGGKSLFSDGRETSARFIDDAVAKYGYAVCVSAGNNGPALSTVGSPATSRRAYSIGAWCPSSTQTSNYGVLDPEGGSLFGFSSRGPLPGGATGVDFLAPGAAVSAVPEWALVAGENMNGTSMAAPQASGAIAALLSAARHEGIEVTPAKLLAALRKSAVDAGGLTPVEQGYGLMDARGALTALRETQDAPDPVLFHAVRQTPNGPGGGFHLRGSVGDDPIDIEARIEPDLPEDYPPAERARFRRMLRLETDAPWLSVATPIHAASDGASLRATADPGKLETGLNSTVIRIVDIRSGEEVGRMPVTIIRPVVAERCGPWIRETFTLHRGKRESLFVRVPPGATMARVEARETMADDGTRIALRALDHRVRQKGAGQAEDLKPGKATVFHTGVREGTTLEIVVNRPFRAPPGRTIVDVGVAFKGLTTAEGELRIPAGRLGSHLNLRASGRVRGRFRSSLEWLEEPLAMSYATRKTPNAPELLGEETLFVHEGTGTFRVGKDRTEIRFDLRFETPYEDYLDDAAWQVEDGNGKIVAKGHVWRGPFSFKAPRRGRYTLKTFVWERGRRFFRDGTIFSPVLLKKTRGRSVGVRQDVLEGFVPGGPSGSRFDLPDGTRTAALITRPKGAGTIHGTLHFRDDEWGVDLLSIPAVVEPPSLPGAEEELKAGLRVLLSDAMADAMDAEKLPAGQLARATGYLEVARAAGIATPGDEAALHLIRARTGTEAAKSALVELDAIVGTLGKAKKEEKRPVFLARAEVAVLAGDIEKAKADLQQSGGDDEAVRRVRFLLAKAAKPGEALKALDRLLQMAPPSPALSRARFDLLLAAGKRADAERLLAGWSGEFPMRSEEVLEMAGAMLTGKD